MKKLIFSALSLFLAVLTFSSCSMTTKDLMTADAKTGGILVPTGSIAYLLGLVFISVKSFVQPELKNTSTNSVAATLYIIFLFIVLLF